MNRWDQNITLTATNHGDPNLLCLPPKSTDYFTFFVTNYFIHAATIVTRPGQGLFETAVETLNALFVPGAGGLRAIRFLILRATIDREDSLRTAAKAGALCMVVKRSDIRAAWRGDGGVWFNMNRTPEYILKDRVVLGQCHYPEDIYTLIEVPSHMPLKTYHPRLSASSSLASSQGSSSTNSSIISSRSKTLEIPPATDIPKLFISIFQTVWGAVTLYDARGNQIQIYGYGAFGLTVAPYVIMSLLNLITNLLRPSYPNLYLVHSQDMDDARRDGGKFSGMVATIDTSRLSLTEPISLDNENEENRTLLLVIIGYVSVALIPIIIVWASTGFREGSDLEVQRAWILAWLVVGSVSSVWVVLFADTVVTRSTMEGDMPSPRQALFFSMPLWIPAIGGMVVVGRMLRDFGICSRLD